MGERANLTAKKPEAKTVNSVSHVRQTGVSRSADSPVDQILFLQRTIGNQAVQRLIKSGNLQTKLRVGQPGDRYEQQAERMADTVMNKPEPQNLKIEGGPVQTQQLYSTTGEEIHRQSEEQDEEEEPVQLSREIDTGQYIQRQEQEEEEPVQLNQEIDSGQYIQRQEQEEEEEPVQLSQEIDSGQYIQRQEQEEEEEPVQLSQEIDTGQYIQRQEQEEEEEPVQLSQEIDTGQYLQRQEQEEEEEPVQLSQEIDTGQHLQRQEQEEEELVQTKAPDTSPDTGPDLQNQLTLSRGSGSPLPEQTSAFMESGFGTDFSDVKVHHDNQASEMSKALNAQAFTSGNDIYFGAGRYSPGTTSGDRLLAHELTHVTQQRSSSVAQGFPQLVSRSSTEKNDIIYRQPAALSATEGKTTSKSAADIAPGEIDLKGKSDFIPEGAIADYFATRKTGKVKVRFGNMANGIIKVKKSRDKYQIPKNESIPLTHPVFAGAPEFKPSLKLFTSGTGIRGYIGIGKGRSDQDLVSALRKAPDIFGLVGFDISKVPKITNELKGGSLHLGINGATIKLGSAFTGKFSLGAVNENINTFEGNAKIQNIPKLGSAEMELKRSKEGDITGKVTLDTQIKNVTGNFIIIWEKGVISGEGKVGYQGEKLSGSVTLKIMEKSQAEQLEQEKKAPEGKVPALRPKAGKARRVNYVVFGEGDLTFSFTEWLAGSAHVIIDHKGFLTVIGKITPAKEIELFPQKDYNKKLFKVEARASYGIPVVGNIFIFANIGMDAFANIGPGKLYNITVEGTYSTDPKKAQSFSIRGSLNVSAGAGLRLRGEAGAGLEILAHDIKAGAGISGIAGIRGYAEATPVIGYREKAKEGEDKKGEFFIRGDLEIAAQPFLGLSGDLFVEIDAPWWSPVPDKRWTWPLVNKEWPIGGSMGMKASVDYVFGSNVPPAVEIKPAEFSAEKFMTDLYSDKAKSKSGGEKDQKGKWQEKNAKTAEPPKAGKKGDAQVGKAPELPPAKSKVKPGGAKKTKKPVDPNAKTAEGKSVKEYQEEASKTGKKPEGKEPKGAKSKSKQKERGISQEAPEDVAASKKVKSAVKDTLKGKTITSKAQADQLISQVYSTFEPKGLKGIKFISDPKNMSMVKLMISASIADIINMRIKPKGLIPIAINLRTRTSTTSLYVFFDGNKPFPTNGKPFQNKSKKHAEERFIDNIKDLIDLINQRRESLKTPPGKPVPVTLDINRLPCDERAHNCANKLARIADEYQDTIKLRINAASVWRKTLTYNRQDFTSDAAIQEMLNAGIEIQPLHVWEIIKKKLLDAGVQEIKISKNNVLNLNMEAGDYASDAYGVEEKVRDAAKQLNLEWKVKQELSGVGKGTIIRRRKKGGKIEETRLK